MVVPVKISSENRRTSSNSNSHSSTATPRNIMDKRSLVGNFKEYRIESNYSQVKIVGNSNRVLIQQNDGILEIVGNSNNVKILKNSGEIKYVGNNGKIYIGCESIVQKVDYVGCNGVLKIPKTVELEKKIFSHDKSKKSPPTARNGGYNICIHNNVTISSSSSSPDATTHINLRNNFKI
ncbi:hypothetical protein ACFFRR_008461 [Megaselia abdita]